MRNELTERTARVLVVIPCYRVRAKILHVLAEMPPEVLRVIVVDDACPQESGRHVETECRDPRVRVIYHKRNLGVGGAMVTGFKAALEEGCDIVVKVDGDGQMDPKLIPDLITPILSGEADFTKGNRFYMLEALRQMPLVRKLGNAGLSIMNKLVTGYWDIMDPTNGFIAIHARVLELLPLRKLEPRFFFESDMLFRLGIARAVVMDIPMDAVYYDEVSNLKIRSVILEFPPRYAVRFIKRIFYTYYLRDFNVCSLQMLFGVGLLFGGLIFGGLHWYANMHKNVFTPTGTVMLAAVQVVLGFQLVLSALSFDVQNVPRRCLHLLPRLRRSPKERENKN